MPTTYPSECGLPFGADGSGDGVIPLSMHAGLLESVRTRVKTSTSCQDFNEKFLTEDDEMSDIS
jgi:hypothetical protein